MSETYVECLVARKPSLFLKILKILLIVLTVGFFMLGTIYAIGFVLAIAAGIGAYIVSLNADVEYEYLYLDKEISVDAVKAKSRRKRVGTFQVDKMEILAPLNSYRLDEYKNRQLKTVDYSTGEEAQPERRYAMICNGDTKVIFEPNAAMVKAVYNVAPRKVFTD